MAQLAPTETSAPIVPERVRKIVAHIDLANAGSIYWRKIRPHNRRRQSVVRFLGAEGADERFEIKQVVPRIGGPEARIPTDAQFGAVEDFYGFALSDDATQQEAHLLLCVRDYAQAIANSRKLSLPRRHLLARFIAAYISQDTGIRYSVRSWCNHAHHDRRDIRAGIANHYPHRIAAKFSEKVVLDVQGAGSKAFG